MQTVIDEETPRCARKLTEEARTMTTLAVALLVAACIPAGAQEGLVADPRSPELLALAEPLAIDHRALLARDEYGCGPLLEPGATYYVAMTGDDAGDGRSWQTAWRTVRHGAAQLAAGDTLVIGEGEYIEQSVAMNVEREQSGSPGRPITITAAPRARVVITGGEQPELTRAEGTGHCWQAPLALPDGRAAVWETDTQILLQPTGSLAMADELPGTWWYDAEAQDVFVHFADSRGAEVHGISVRPGPGSTSNFRSKDSRGLDIRADYVCLRGLHLRNYHTGLLISGNRVQAGGEEPSFRGGTHVTVEDCSFSSTTFAGVVLWQGARWNLLRDCYGALNGDRGSMLVNHETAEDNLFLHNRFDSSAPTVREGGWAYHYGVSTYGHVGRRNHIVGNVMNDVQSFRSKYTFRETVLEGNVMMGHASTVPCTYPGSRPDELWLEPRDRTVVRGNVLLSGFATSTQAMPDSGPTGPWLDRYRVFVNNFVPGADRAASIEAARFADPAWLDYRLQADSPLRGAGLGGHDVGAHGAHDGRMLYVAPGGDDANAGDTRSAAFATLAKASAELLAGDTLYVLPGEWTEPLVIAASGTQHAPITVRAYGRQEILLPGIAIAGEGVAVEGFAVAGAAGNGISVEGNRVAIRECVVSGCGGAGIAGRGAAGLSVEHCTIARNGRGMDLDAACVGATMRDCVVADNREGGAVLAPGLAGFLASNTCYHGPGLDTERIASERRSILADPGFVNADAGDLRLRWDSPAAHLAPYGRPAGARRALPRTPQIADVAVAAVSSDAAIVTWRTPLDDTTGSVRFREAGADQWRTVRRDTLGTVHGAALMGLAPGAEFEYQVLVRGLRGGSASGETRRLATTDRPHEPITYYLAEAGDDAADGLSPQTAWRTLRRASFAVMPGDTVLLAPGTYTHPIAPLCAGTEGRPITFRREGDGPAIIDGLGIVAPLVDLIGKSHVTVAGLIFDNLPREGHPGVIRARSCEGLEVLNCRIAWTRPHAGFGNGIELYRCPDARVEGNVIWGTRYHIVLNNSPGTLVKNNTISWGQVFSLLVQGAHEGARLVNNSLYYPTSVPNAAIAIAWPDRAISLTSDYNCFGDMVEGTRVAYVYHSSVNDVGPTGLTLADWQADSDMDVHSIQADPLFVAPREGDFRLAPGSPAIGAGESGVNIGALDERLLRGGRATQ
ncbi:MAG: right-handed parallel beta-helix repeat-containing protein [Thermoguttaceae bacterium]|nr:right-handed parallel beta-helix repeat-containing protein [Thermoguttaceae bacterium]